jgi:hypothetical protein
MALVREAGVVRDIRQRSIGLSQFANGRAYPDSAQVFDD